MQPPVVYLDSSDWSRLSDPRRRSVGTDKIRDRLRNHAQEGTARFVFSAAHLCEMAPLRAAFAPLEHVLKLPGLLECDEAANQLNHGEIVLCESFPPDEQATKAVVPTVGALDYPSPRFAAHAADEWLLSSSTNVRRDPSNANGSLCVLVVVALVQAQVCWASRSTRCSDHDRVER